MLSSKRGLSGPPLLYSPYSRPVVSASVLGWGPTSWLWSSSASMYVVLLGLYPNRSISEVLRSDRLNDGVFGLSLRSDITYLLVLQPLLILSFARELKVGCWVARH